MFRSWKPIPCCRCLNDHGARKMEVAPSSLRRGDERSEAPFWERMKRMMKKKESGTVRSKDTNPFLKQNVWNPNKKLCQTRLGLLHAPMPKPNWKLAHTPPFPLNLFVFVWAKHFLLRPIQPFFFYTYKTNPFLYHFIFFFFDQNNTLFCCINFTNTFFLHLKFAYMKTF